jgi:hypothetical protein
MKTKGNTVKYAVKTQLDVDLGMAPTIMHNPYLVGDTHTTYLVSDNPAGYGYEGAKSFVRVDDIVEFEKVV